MIVYVPHYPEHAGHYIYRGYEAAWKELGYDVRLVEATRTDNDGDGSIIRTNFDNINPPPGEYIVQGIASLLGTPKSYELIENSHKSFVHVQPNAYPNPWGAHPNFMCGSSIETMRRLNSLKNVHLWTFGDETRLHFKWKKVHTIPLAFDHVNYQREEHDKFKKFDVCFIGGWANNGFNEKRKIMLDIFKEFKSSGLNCGIFIEKNLTHDQEQKILHNSKITLNIHDNYQRILGHDTNERTFKSLGLNGLLVSDTVGQLTRMFPDIQTTNEPKKMVEICKELLSLEDKELEDIREGRRQDVLDNHCYIHRVKSMLELPEAECRPGGVDNLPPEWKNFLSDAQKKEIERQMQELLA
jgi:hypothetical protein